MASSGTTVAFPNEEQILITREFDAPRRLVYRAWTEPELVGRWWGGEQGEVTSVRIDLRVGGAWRCVLVTSNGSEAAFRGKYREIVPNERIVSTEVYEGMPESEALNTVTFTEEEGRTTLTVLVQHGSKEARDAHIGSGMETGMREALDLLEKVAVSLHRAEERG
jgi:uncharacterized protein YndB with AHSA1/START domain